VHEKQHQKRIASVKLINMENESHKRRAGSSLNQLLLGGRNAGDLSHFHLDVLDRVATGDGEGERGSISSDEELHTCVVAKTSEPAQRVKHFGFKSQRSAQLPVELHCCSLQSSPVHQPNNHQVGSRLPVQLIDVNQLMFGVSLGSGGERGS
jgi:hypothetical protein